MVETIKKKIIKNKEEIIKVLLEIETENVAINEINLSVKALENNCKYIKEKNYRY